MTHRRELIVVTAFVSWLGGCAGKSPMAAAQADSRTAVVAHASSRTEDAVSDAKEIGQGTKPAVALDASRRVLHLVYRVAEKLFYRAGDLQGTFGAAEHVMAYDTQQLDPADPTTTWEKKGALWDPRIVIDRNGDPHVVVSSGNYMNRFTWYSNRIGGRWKEKLVVVDKVADLVTRATMPSLAVDDDGTVYVAVFSPVGTGIDKSQAKGVWTILARIQDTATQPRIAVKTRSLSNHAQIVLARGGLWVGGMRKKMGYCLEQIDKDVLEPTAQPPVCLATGPGLGEGARMFVDSGGDIHMAGSHWDLKNNPAGGWYNSLSRTRRGLPPVHYRTTMRHAWGAGLPIVDHRTPGRVYVVHWSGAAGDKFGEIFFENYSKAAGNQIRFARIDGERASVQHQAVTNRPAIHGFPRRATPPAVAHPDGGIIVVFQELGASPPNESDETGTLFFTRVGQPDAQTTVGPAARVAAIPR